VEVGLEIWHSLHPLLLSVVFTVLGNQSVDLLRKERAALKDELRALVSKLGPKLYGPDFEKKRVIKPEMIRRMSGSGFNQLAHHQGGAELFAADEEF